MAYETLTLSQNQDVVTVTLNRPDVHNAMNEQLITELVACFEKLRKDDTVRIIILTGNGASFCAGADLKWMKGITRYTKKEHKRDSQLIYNLYDTIHSCPKPVIGKINGNAFGGGVGLVAICDLSIAVPEALFAFSEVKLGIIRSGISSFVSLRLSPATMRRLFLTGERFDASYAEQIGLLDFVAPKQDIDMKIQSYVNLFRSSGPVAMREVKQLINQMTLLERDAYIQHTIEKIATLRMSGEGQEGLSAFLEKRKPRWSK